MSVKRDKSNEIAAIERLLHIMDELREQCPWDKKQTFESLRHLTIEETYELADAILDDDKVEINNELGDLLLHIVFYARIGSETGDFNLSTIANDICDKLISRHPHIYGDVAVENEEDVKRNWENLKLKEGRKSVFSGVPKSLPALVKSGRIQDKAAGVGFDWDDRLQVLDKVREELDELEVEIKNGNQNLIEAEFGDVLFSLVNYARFIKVNPETALERTNKKFIKRFQLMEGLMKEENKSFEMMNLEQMDYFWEKAKKLE
ncbi:MAG: nucleoside triphosphate pyrophosphohydrolase [Flavobacteriaceae bacterium]